MFEKISNDLLNIIKTRETVTTEFKTAKDKLPSSLFESVCAFLNRNRWAYFSWYKRWWGNCWSI